jgi:hypothetical protein
MREGLKYDDAKYTAVRDLMKKANEEKTGPYLRAGEFLSKQGFFRYYHKGTVAFYSTNEDRERIF